MASTLPDDIVQHLPHLHAFARMLARDRTLADDLVQETMVRALAHADQFETGTNLKAWLSTILRNSYFNEKRSQGRLVQLDMELLTESQSIRGEQEGRLRLRDFQRAFATLPASQRKALVLVGASGFSYDQAARIAGCAVGTMKSRVSRARLQLGILLDGREPCASPSSSRRFAYAASLPRFAGARSEAA